MAQANFTRFINKENKLNLLKNHEILIKNILNIKKILFFQKNM